MYVLFIGDVFLVEVVDIDGLLTVAGAELLEEVGQELIGILLDVFARVLADKQHLAHM